MTINDKITANDVANRSPALVVWKLQIFTKADMLNSRYASRSNLKMKPNRNYRFRKV